ncbi:MAG: hypothetical protein Q9206_002324 [Seirophora lacunosa]
MNSTFLVWSAQDEKGLQRICAAFESYINSLEPMKDEVRILANLCLTLAAKREIAAAYCTGAVSHKLALKIAFYRGLSASSLLQEWHTPGAMMAVGLREDDVLPYLSRIADLRSQVQRIPYMLYRLCLSQMEYSTACWRKSDGGKARSSHIDLVSEVGPHGSLKEASMDNLKEMKSTQGIIFTTSLLTRGVTQSPWGKHHKINDTLLYPAAGFIIMATEAARISAAAGKRITNYHLREFVSKQLYDILNTSASSFGPTFRGLKAIRYDGRGAASAHVDPYAWTPKLPDSVTLVVLPKGGRKPMLTMVPMSIVRLQISADLYNCREPALDVSANRESGGSRSAEFSTLASRPDDSKVLLYCRRKAQTVSEPGLSSSEVQAAAKPLCYSVEWKPDLGLMTREQIQTYCSSGSTPILDPGRLMVPEKDVLYRIAFDNITNNIDEQIVHDRSPHLGHYRDWMNHFVLSSSPRLEDHSSIHVPSFGTLECEVENNDSAGQPIVRITRNLQKILEGEIDALGLLFEDSLTNVRSFLQ